MAEVVGLVASVIQVASSGLVLSRTLRDYSSAVQGSERRLRGLDKDIYFTSNIISELGTLLNDPRVQGLVSERSIQLTREIVAEFEGMFEAIRDVIEAIRTDSLGKWKIYFRESKIGLLLSNLDRLKGNLNLLIGVITNASQISTEHPSEATMLTHRINILELMVEKEEYTQKYLEEKRKYDDLMARINSNSTLGSVSTVQTGNAIAGPSNLWRREMSREETEVCEEATLDESPNHRVNGGEIEASTIGQASPPPDASFLDSIPENEAYSERMKQDALRLRSELASLKASVGAIEKASMPTSFSTQPAFSALSASKTQIAIKDWSGNSISPPTRLYEGGSNKPNTVTALSSPLQDNTQPADTSSLDPAPKPPPVPTAKPPPRQKREAALKMSKKIAKGAGYTAAGVIFIITLPIGLPAWLVWRRTRGRTLSMPDDAGGGVDSWDGGRADGAEWDYSYYDSHQIPGELPAAHELASGDLQQPDMRLVGELTNRGYGANY